MTGSIGTQSPEGQHQDIHRDVRKNFKKRMQLSILLSGRERKAIASDMKIIPSLLCDWLNEGKPESMPAHFLASWTKEVGKDVLRWIAKENGIALVDEEDIGPVHVANPAHLLALISQHHGKAMAQMIHAQADGVIDDEERFSIWPELCRLIQELEAQAEHYRPRSKSERMSA